MSGKKAGFEKPDQMDKKKTDRGIIISGGRIEDDFACAFLSREGIEGKEGRIESRVIAADRGLVFCSRHGIIPGHIVGDFDSADAGLADSYREIEGVEITVYPVKKDYTDTQIAVELAIRLGMKEVVLLGATGTRQDHFLGNIQVLENALRRGVRVLILDSHNRIRMIGKEEDPDPAGSAGESTGAELVIPVSEQFGDYFSLIPWGGRAEHITVRGAAYEVTDKSMSTSESLGISNEPVGTAVYISVGKGKLIVAESRD